MQVPGKLTYLRSQLADERRRRVERGAFFRFRRRRRDLRRARLLRIHAASGAWREAFFRRRLIHDVRRIDARSSAGLAASGTRLA
jgi:hypothetical protein